MEKVNRLITIDSEMNEKLKKIAESDNRSVNNMINVALSYFIDARLNEQKLTSTELLKLTKEMNDPSKPIFKGKYAYWMGTRQKISSFKKYYDE